MASRPLQWLAGLGAIVGWMSVPPVGICGEKSITIGISAAFRGPSRGLGIELYRGAQAYLQEVNAAGGVHGRKIILKAYDDGYSPTPAIENTVRLIEDDDVFLLFGYVGTPTVTRVLPLLQRYQARDVFLLCPFTGAQPLRQPPYDQFVFNLRASYRGETAGLVDHLVGIDRKRIAVFYQIDAYGRSGWEGVRSALTRHGLSMVAEATYRRGATFGEDFRTQVEVLKRSGPDAIISIGAYAACAGFIRDARDAGLTVPIANVSFVGSENLLKLLEQHGTATGRDYTSQLLNSQVVPSYHDRHLPAVREYHELMAKHDPQPPEAATGDAYTPLPHCFVGFEGFLDAKLLVEILGRMGPNPQRRQLRSVVEGLHSLDLGIDVPISFGPRKHQGLEQIYYTVVAEGRLIPLTDWNQWHP